MFGKLLNTVADFTTDVVATVVTSPITLSKAVVEHTEKLFEKIEDKID
jgi:molybdopterin-biosynthesis enzyme MoeA-like protein